MRASFYYRFLISDKYRTGGSTSQIHRGCRDRLYKTTSNFFKLRTGRYGEQNNDDYAYQAKFDDLTVLGASVSHAMLFTERYRGTTSRRLSIWLHSAVDFDGHVDELSKTYGKPNEITQSLGNQASPVAFWSTAADGIAYELVFEGGIASEEEAAIHLTARYASEEKR